MLWTPDLIPRFKISGNFETLGKKLSDSFKMNFCTDWVFVLKQKLYTWWTETVVPHPFNNDLVDQKSIVSALEHKSSQYRNMFEENYLLLRPRFPRSLRARTSILPLFCSDVKE